MYKNDEMTKKLLQSEMDKTLDVHTYLVFYPLSANNIITLEPKAAKRQNMFFLQIDIIPIYYIPFDIY